MKFLLVMMNLISMKIFLQRMKFYLLVKKAKLGDSSAIQLELDNDADKENIKIGDFL